MLDVLSIPIGLFLTAGLTALLTRRTPRNAITLRGWVAAALATVSFVTTLHSFPSDVNPTPHTTALTVAYLIGLDFGLLFMLGLFPWILSTYRTAQIKITGASLIARGWISAAITMACFTTALRIGPSASPQQFLLDFFCLLGLACGLLIFLGVLSSPFAPPRVRTTQSA